MEPSLRPAAHGWGGEPWPGRHGGHTPHPGAVAGRSHLHTEPFLPPCAPAAEAGPALPSSRLHRAPGPPSRARPIATGPAPVTVPRSYWPARSPRRCLSWLSRLSLAPPGPPRKFEKKKSFMGGWKGLGQRRGREGPEERRRAAERGGGGGIPAPLSPNREPSPPFCLLLPPPRGAAMTVSDPRPPGQPPCVPGEGESDGRSPAAPLLGSSLLTFRRLEKVSSGRPGRPVSPSPSLLLTFAGQEPGRPQGHGIAPSRAAPPHLCGTSHGPIQGGPLLPPLQPPW